MKTSHKEKNLVLDMCCGGRMFWFEKAFNRALYLDIREPQTFTTGLGKHKRNRRVNPDLVMDFRELELPSGKFTLVVFDPPHLSRVGAESFTAKTYGRLDPDNWREDIQKGFAEGFRVLKPEGILIFKWCEFEIPLRDILPLSPYRPLFGHKSGKQQKTHWLTFMKLPELTNED